jgi:hypothetical protein
LRERRLPIGLAEFHLVIRFCINGGNRVMRATKLVVGLAGLALASGTVFAADLGSQNFNGLSTAGGPSFDSLPAGSQLTNTNASNSGGGGLDFATYWAADTRGNPNGTGPVFLGNDTSDFIGVNSFAGSNSPDVAPGGAAVSSGTEHNFEFNDGDGRLELRFAPVDATGNTNITVSFNYWINGGTSFEDSPTDMFFADLTDGTTTVSILSLLNGTAINAQGSADDGTDNWKLASISNVETLGLDISQLQLIISNDCDSSSENIFVDNISFTGVPTPGSMALLGVGGLVGLRRRR